jgi:hypothetical protein
MTDEANFLGRIHHQRARQLCALVFIIERSLNCLVSVRDANYVPIAMPLIHDSKKIDNDVSR